MQGELAEYINQLKGWRSLTKEEEIRYSRRARKGDKQAKDKLITALLPLGIRIAKRFNNCGIDLADLVSETNVKLVKNITKFDPEKGRLSTWATPILWRHLHDYVSRTGRIIRRPKHVAMKGYLQKTGGVERDVFRSSISPILSLDEEFGPSRFSLKDERQERKEPSPLEELYRSEDAEKLNKNLERLDGRTRDILIRASRGETMRSIGKDYDICTQRVQQIRRNGITKLRKIYRVEDAENIHWKKI